jgi:YD repeat-containing protein
LNAVISGLFFDPVAGGGGGGSDYITSYTYDVLDHLLTVTMPRSTGTQTRTFTYSGQYLMSATNPENGAVRYTYNTSPGVTYGKITTKTDAKGQQVQYSYDTYGRLSHIGRFLSQGGGFVEDTCQAEDHYYDTNPFDATLNTYANGLPTAVQYKGATGYGGACNTTFQEMIGYAQTGAATKQRLRIVRSGYSSADLDANFTYDTEGRMSTLKYPDHLGGTGVTLTYGVHARQQALVARNLEYFAGPDHR